MYVSEIERERQRERELVCSHACLCLYTYVRTCKYTHTCTLERSFSQMCTTHMSQIAWSTCMLYVYAGVYMYLLCVCVYLCIHIHVYIWIMECVSLEYVSLCIICHNIYQEMSHPTRWALLHLTRPATPRSRGRCFICRSRNVANRMRTYHHRYTWCTRGNIHKIFLASRCP